MHDPTTQSSDKGTEQCKTEACTVPILAPAEYLARPAVQVARLAASYQDQGLEASWQAPSTRHSMLGRRTSKAFPQAAWRTAAGFSTAAARWTKPSDQFHGRVRVLARGRGLPDDRPRSTSEPMPSDDCPPTCRVQRLCEQESLAMHCCAADWMLNRQEVPRCNGDASERHRAMC